MINELGKESVLVMSVHRGARWRELVASLATMLSSAPPGPFETVAVLVSSRGAGRMLSQALAAELPTGICAGVSFLTLDHWIRTLAAEHGLAEDLLAWRSVRAAVVASQALDTISQEHGILGAHLNSNGSPARRQQLAQRSVQLFGRYIEHAPGMVGRWLGGDDVDALGRGLPGHLAWQPALLRLVAERLEVDPVEVWDALAHAVAGGPGRAPLVFALPEVPRAPRQLLAALASRSELHVWQVQQGGFEDWTEGLAAGVDEPATQPSTRPAPPPVELHGSHGPARQVEVLRDELTRRFEADPTLEPRDVVIVCQDPPKWWPHLRTAFAPVDGDPSAHPGRCLRVQTGSELESNLVVEVILRCLRLDESRATASDLTELFLLSPITHRWRLAAHREELLELVAGSGIRWGLDRHHREQLEVPGISQNTWVRGVDRLLAGIALSPGSSAPLAITGVEGVATSNLELAGALAELLSRIRRFNLTSGTPASAAVWVERVRALLADVVGCSFDDEWMLLQANSALTDLADQLADQHTELRRGEFTRLFAALTSQFTPRPTVGNGSLQVIGVGDLAHVDFRLVCLLGIGDGHGGGEVDSVELGPTVLEPRRRRLSRLLAHARAADEVLVVGQSRDPLTNQPVARPTTISWFLRELGADAAATHEHPILAHSEGNFTGRHSYDQQGLAAARALRAATGRTSTPHETRRREALGRPLRDQELEVGVRELVGFLKDPAKDFLRSAAGVRLYEAPELSDEMPFVLDGLEEWGVRDRLLQAFKEGAHPDEAAAREAERELLPPGQVGRRLLAEPLGLTKDLWLQAFPDWSSVTADHRVELELGGVVLADTIRTRGGRVVEVTASRGRPTEVQPWLQQLALAASGVQAHAVVHRSLRRFGKWELECSVLTPPGQEAAMDVLGTIARAYAQGRSRLIPLPQAPALEFASEIVSGRFQSKEWEIPSSDWKRARWTRIPHQWRLFYGDIPAELFTDPVTERDPEPPDGFSSAFAAWAAAIYRPLIEGGN